MLQDAHEGYEYQDYLTVAIIFDDLKVINTSYIHFPDNFYILLYSQPISELDELYRNGYQNTEIQR